jgi:hypothetical protein
MFVIEDIGVQDAYFKYKKMLSGVRVIPCFNSIETERRDNGFLRIRLMFPDGDPFEGGFREKFFALVKIKEV